MALSQSDIARALGVDPSMIVRWKARGMPIYSIEAAAAWRSAHIRPRMRPMKQQRPATRTADDFLHQVLVDAQARVVASVMHETGVALDVAVLAYLSAVSALAAHLEAAGETDGCESVLWDVTLRPEEIEADAMRVLAELRREAGE